MLVDSPNINCMNCRGESQVANSENLLILPRQTQAQISQHLENPRFFQPPILEYWNTGILEYWNNGILE